MSEGLNHLKIVINYAKATSANSEEKVSSFMKKIYRENSMKNFEMILKLNVRKKLNLFINNKEFQKKISKRSRKNVILNI